jgi:16S rRNA (guanine1516-N2)-methyltransferase
MPLPPTVAVTCSIPAARAAAMVLARKLGLPFVELPSNSIALKIVQTETAVELHDSRSGARLVVEFTAAELKRYRAGGSGPNPLRRAIGAGQRHVVDATAGLGRDAVHLAALGYRVSAIERNAIVAALARDGLRRARTAELLGDDNPCWHVGDARVILPQLEPPPATVYLDPMFPAKRKKSAEVRKEMRLLRLLVQDDDDAAELLAVARRHALDRVVVKRPLAAPPLATDTSATYRGKLVRYDVYRTPKPK